MNLVPSVIILCAPYVRFPACTRKPVAGFQGNSQQISMIMHMAIQIVGQHRRSSFRELIGDVAALKDDVLKTFLSLYLLALTPHPPTVFFPPFSFLLFFFFLFFFKLGKCNLRLNLNVSRGDCRSLFCQLTNQLRIFRLTDNRPLSSLWLPPSLEIKNG